MIRIFIYKHPQKSYMTNGLFIYSAYIRKPFLTLPYIWICNCSTLNFLTYENFFSFFISVRCLLHMYVYRGGGGRGNKVANKISTFSSQSDQLNFLPDFPPVFPEPCGGGGEGEGGGGRGGEGCWRWKKYCGTVVLIHVGLWTLSSHHSRGRTLERNWEKSFQSFSSLLFTVTSTHGGNMEQPYVCSPCPV